MSFDSFRRLALATAFAVAAATPAVAANPDAPLAPATVPATALSTPNFIRMASQGDAFERAAGSLAEKAGDTQVRKFGARLVRDHTKTTDELHAAIRKAGMTVPPAPGLTTDQQQMLSQLKGKTGAAFDHAYLQDVIATHKEALGLAEAYAAHGDSAPLAQAAKNAAVIVKDHLRSAERLSQGKSSGM